MNDERFRAFYNIERLKEKNLYVMNICIDCKLEYQGEYYVKNRDRILERNRQYREVDRKISEQRRQYWKRLQQPK
jgi:hypothetical protein